MDYIIPLYTTLKGPRIYFPSSSFNEFKKYDVAEKGIAVRS